MFLGWISTGGGRLVVGGRVRLELSRSSPYFRAWMYEALKAGRVISKRDDEVELRETKISQEATFRSDDPHVLALAQVSGLPPAIL